jgi:hypothetical protein
MREKIFQWDRQRVTVKPEGVTQDHYIVIFSAGGLQKVRESGEQPSQSSNWPKALVFAKGELLNITWLKRPTERLEEYARKVREFVEEYIASDKDESSSSTQ